MKQHSDEKSDDGEYLKKIDRLSRAIEHMNPPMRQLISRSFVQGIFVALGTTVGLSIVLAILTFIITQLKFIPFVGDFVDKTNIEKYLPKEDGN
jgi:hypothetical protein